MSQAPLPPCGQGLTPNGPPLFYHGGEHMLMSGVYGMYGQDPATGPWVGGWRGVHGTMLMR